MKIFSFKCLICNSYYKQTPSGNDDCILYNCRGWINYISDDFYHDNDIRNHPGNCAGHIRYDKNSLENISYYIPIKNEYILQGNWDNDNHSSFMINGKSIAAIDFVPISF